MPRLAAFLLLVWSSCGASPEVADPHAPTMGWAAAPAGELALPVRHTVVHADPIRHRWADALGREWTAGFRVAYATDEEHEAMAHACVLHHWPRALAAGIAALERVNLTEVDEVEAWTRELCARLDEILFPCEVGLPVGRVTGIEWLVRRTR